jgi:hypothetical protein
MDLNDDAYRPVVADVRAIMKAISEPRWARFDQLSSMPARLAAFGSTVIAIGTLGDEANGNQIAGRKFGFDTSHSTHVHVWQADVSES